MLTILLAESELELVPEALWKEPSVAARAKKRRREPRHLLLDQAADHKAMRLLPEGDRRGRPDIAHVVTLLVQDSPLTARGETRLLLHTRHDELVHVRPDTRIMRNQAKFYTLLEDLLRQGRVPLDDPLLTLEKGRPLASVLAREAKGHRVLLDESGAPARSAAFARLARAHADLTVVLGGFPKGAWRAVDPAGFDEVLRVHDAPVSAWTALVPVLAGLEDARLEGAA